MKAGRTLPMGAAQLTGSGPVVGESPATGPYCLIDGARHAITDGWTTRRSLPSGPSPECWSKAKPWRATICSWEASTMLSLKPIMTGSGALSSCSKNCATASPAMGTCQSVDCPPAIGQAAARLAFGFAAMASNASTVRASSGNSPVSRRETVGWVTPRSSASSACERLRSLRSVRMSITVTHICAYA